MSIKARFNHHFVAKAPLSNVSDFHKQPESMAAITPPPVRVEFHHTPQNLSNGSEIAFTLWFGPLPFHWVARIDDLSENGFTDRQIKGPFLEWVHVHSFEMLDDATTAVRDEISLQLRPHLLWGLVGLGFYIGLPLLFAYRAWKTRRLLKRGFE